MSTNLLVDGSTVTLLPRAETGLIVSITHCNNILNNRPGQGLFAAKISYFCFIPKFGRVGEHYGGIENSEKLLEQKTLCSNNGCYDILGPFFCIFNSEPLI